MGALITGLNMCGQLGSGPPVPEDALRGGAMAQQCELVLELIVARGEAPIAVVQRPELLVRCLGNLLSKTGSQACALQTLS